MPVRILVVDDEPDMELLVRGKFRRQIAAKEYEFHFARNGAEALEKLRETPEIEVVFTDINMPVMDGLTFLLRLGELNSLVKAVVVSAYGDMKNIRTAMNRGAFDFLMKPIDFGDMEITLNRTVQSLLGTKRAVFEHDQLVAIRQELDIANNIQQAMLPRVPAPYLDPQEIDLEARMVPALDVGGDFYDFFPIGDNKLGLVIGDVSGKGVPAAILMAESRTLLRAAGITDIRPAECLAYVNRLLCADNSSEMFVTVFYASLDQATGELLYCNAGHNPPIFVGRDGRVESLTGQGNVIMGIVSDARFHSGRVVMEPGDTLCLYTDGISEAENDGAELFSAARLAALLRETRGVSSQQLVQTVLDTVNAHAAGCPQSDDMTILTLRFLKPSRRTGTGKPAASLSMRVPNSPDAIARLSHALSTFGEREHVPSRTMLVTSLIVEEIVVNATSYGYAESDPDTHDILVELEFTGMEMHVRIEDDGMPFNPLDAPEADLSGSADDRAIGGLGIHLVRKLAAYAQYRRENNRNILTLTVPCEEGRKTAS